MRNIKTSFTTVTSQNTTHSWYFFHYNVNLLLPLSCLLPSQTSLKLCKRKSDLLFRMLQLVFVIVSMTQYVQNFNLQIDHICWRSLTTKSRSLKLYFRSFPYSFPFVSLISLKPKQIRIKKTVNKRRKKT